MDAELIAGEVLEEMTPFWAGLRERRFLLLRCDECGSWYWPFAACRNHANEPFFANMKWTEASGRGTVHTFTRAEWTFNPYFQAPYIYALVELDEGPVMPTNIVGCPHEDVRIGMPVEVVLEDLTPDIVVPRFRPHG